MRFALCRIADLEIPCFEPKVAVPRLIFIRETWPSILVNVKHKIKDEPQLK